MAENPYDRFLKSELILRDELAIDRTILANERTLLAYLRSGVALLIAGVSFIHFAEQWWFLSLGFACLPAGAVTSLVGALRFRRMDRAISVVRAKLGAEAPAERTTAHPGTAGKEP
jgi:putative membrane protein